MKKASETTPLEDGSRLAEDAKEPSHIVAIGASAGGLEAIEEFIRAVPEDTGMAFVLIQHLSPDFKSLMDELLARQTGMDIVPITDGLQPRPNVVHLMPANVELTMRGGLLRTHQRMSRKHDLHLPIDNFLNSLAEDAGAQSIAIILSGTGSDGSRGVCRVYDAGGLVLVQNPDTAKFDGMPRSALMTGRVHASLAPREMPESLIRHRDNLPVLRKYWGAFESDKHEESSSDEEDSYARILSLLRNAYQIDFSHYKPPTIRRRIVRRMELGQIRNLDDYYGILTADTIELESLYRDLLIGVTSFFRDSEAFESLGEYLEELIRAKKDTSDPIRVWDCGCATGEEAYSLAILLDEKAVELEYQGKLTIFATDVHRASLVTASNGVYDAEQLSSVSKERMERYFISEGEGQWRISPSIRNRIVFAPHNLLNDPPFTKMDLVCCRNLLIYVNNDAQNRAIALFHFALEQNGLLFLGVSESLGKQAEEFATLDSKWNIFKRVGTSRMLGSVPLKSPPQSKRSGHSPPMTLSGPAASTTHRLAGDYKNLFDRHMPPGFLLGPNREILHIFGAAKEYLRYNTGRYSSDILDHVEDDLRLAISAILQRCHKEESPVTIRGVRVVGQDGQNVVDMTADPVAGGTGMAKCCFLHFRKHLDLNLTTSEDSAKQDGSEQTFLPGSEAHHRIETLEAELQTTKENLQAMVEELQTTNEELQASNEELLASNEELQSTNEELHSVNEELYSVNAEFEQKNRELEILNRDHQSLLDNLDTGIVYLDSNLRIRKFNQAIATTFRLLPQDVGRPIDHIAYHLDGQNQMLDDLQTVLQSGEPIQKEVCTRDGKVLLKRILPYQALDEQKDQPAVGVAMLFTDITPVKQAEKALRQKQQDDILQAIFENAPFGMAVLDESMHITRKNGSLEEILRRNHSVHHQRCGEDGVRGLGCCLVADGKCVMQGRAGEDCPLRGMFQRLLNTGEAFHHMQVELPDRSGDQEQSSWLDISAARIAWENQNHLLLMVSDVSREKNEEFHQQQVEDQLRQAQKLESLGVMAGGIAHDFNNLLQVILGNASLLSRQLGEEPELGPQLQQISTAARNATDLCRQMLVYAGKGRRHIEPLDLPALLDEVSHILQISISKKASLKIDVAENLPRVDGDPSQMRQLLLNLITNASEALGEKPGTIHVRMRPWNRQTDQLGEVLEGQLTTEGEYVLLSISDTGCGMDRETMQRMFEPFYTTKFTGRGLGLAVVRGIVRSHNGVIAIDTAPGRGTKMQVILPVGQIVSARNPKPEFDMAWKGSGAILLVDDEPLIRKLGTQMLSRMGFTVHAAEDGRVALEMLDQADSPPRAVILDLAMPGLDGIETYREIQKRFPGLKVILSSGHDEAQLRDAQQREGFDGFLLKPYDLATMQSELRDLLSVEDDAPSGF